MAKFWKEKNDKAIYGKLRQKIRELTQANKILTARIESLTKTDKSPAQTPSPPGAR